MPSLCRASSASLRRGAFQALLSLGVVVLLFAAVCLVLLLRGAVRERVEASDVLLLPDLPGVYWVGTLLAVNSK